jgi:hypothetical protein
MVIQNLCNNGMMNCNDIIGSSILAMTSATTGSLFITFLIIVLVLVAFAIMFGIRLEYTAILILPLLLGCMGITKDFIAFGVVILIYLAIILTANFPLK